jgi:hypothetical protein
MVEAVVERFDLVRNQCKHIPFPVETTIYPPALAVTYVVPAKETQRRSEVQYKDEKRDECVRSIALSSTSSLTIAVDTLEVKYSPKKLALGNLSLSYLLQAPDAVCSLVPAPTYAYVLYDTVCSFYYIVWSVSYRHRIASRIIYARAVIPFHGTIRFHHDDDGTSRKECLISRCHNTPFCSLKAPGSWSDRS